STATSPAGMRRSRATGPGVENVSCLITGPSTRSVRTGACRTPSLLLSAATEAPQAVARASGRGCGDGDAAPERADEPRVEGHALACGGRLKTRLQALREPQRDARGRAVVGGSRRRRALLDVHERRVLPREPNLDSTRAELLVQLEGGLAERVEEPEAGRGADRRAQAAGGLGGRVVADSGDGGEIGLERLDEACQLHDVIMTSLRRLSSVRLAAGRAANRTHPGRSVSGARL